MSLATAARQTSGRSAADARTALVAALAAAGLHAGQVAPDSPTPGAAWPQWTLTEWNGHLAKPSRYSFAVYAVLQAGDASTTVADADALVERVAPHLMPSFLIQTAEPVLITFADRTTMPGVRFRVITRA